MKTFLLTLCLVCLKFALFSQQISNGLTASNGKFIGFLEFKPYNYSSNDAKYPLIIFLHGVGERGNGTTDLYKVAWNAIPKYCANGATMTFNYNGQEQSFIVLSPQLSASYGQWENFYVEEMIKYAKQSLRVDPARIYLCGLSLGGGGVWKYASASSANANGLAAIAPVCATNDGNTYCNIAQANLPVWAFHAEDDGTVGVGNTRYVVGQINGCNPGVVPRTTYYPNGGHGIWDRAFDLGHTWQSPENMYEWFLSKSRGTPTAPPPPAPTNQPPVANAGPDASTTLPTNNINLSGSGSTDPDGSITSYSWIKTSGPACSIVNANSVNIAVNALVQGTYVFRLAVTDNNGATSYDEVVVNVNAAPPAPNQPPVANAGADITITLPTNNINLSGSGSTDTDGTITSYSWIKIGGPACSIVNANSVNTAVNALVQGNYVFRLAATDNNGATSYDEVWVTVNAAPPAPNQPPVANAGPDASTTLPTNNINLSGAGSADPDGTLSAYSWIKTSGPTCTIENAGGVNTQVSGLIQGTYVFRLAVTDNNGATSYDEMLVFVNAATSASQPVAVAGSDLTIALPANSVTLNGVNSWAKNGGYLVSHLWSKIAGPSQGTIVNTGNSYVTDVTDLVPGTYTFLLTVKDNSGLSGTDEIIVTVTGNAVVNQPPVANAGADITISLPTNTTALSGAGSSDPDGTVSAYTWTKASGPACTIANASNVNTQVNGLVQGTYIFRLAVTDNNNATSYDEVVVTVNAAPPAPNQPPVANAGADAATTLPVNNISLSGAASSDLDGSITAWSWSKLSGPASYSIASPNSANTQINSLAQGSYTFRLLVTDNNGATASDDVVITVNAASATNQLPVANAGPDIIVNLPANSTVLDATRSFDPDGTISYYGWSRISGPGQYRIDNPWGRTTALTNLVQGTYSFLLVVTDNKGDINKDTVVVEVKTVVAGNQAPVARAGADITLVFPTISTALDGSGSGDADGTITGWSWSKLSGPASYSITSPTAANTEIRSLSEGTYTFRLTVTDNSGATASDDVVVTVNPAGGVNQLPVANAGPDIVITLPTNAGVLDATRSFDPDGSIRYYGWSRISGPVQHSIDNPWGRTTALTNLVQGTYSFLLVVTDNKGDIAKDTVVFTVNAVGGLMAQKNQNATVLNSVSTAISETAKTTLDNISEAKLKLNLFPNPATNQVNLEIRQGTIGKISILITDASGRVISTQYLVKEQATIIKTINLNNLRPGMYYVSIQQADGTKSVRAFVKQ
jgi:poly(3-hydroxybutyrate) depolymerase